MFYDYFVIDNVSWDIHHMTVLLLFPVQYNWNDVLCFIHYIDFNTTKGTVLCYYAPVCLSVYLFVRPSVRLSVTISGLHSYHMFQTAHLKVNVTFTGWMSYCFCAILLEIHWIKLSEIMYFQVHRLCFMWWDIERRCGNQGS